jgi:hypothetical protein
VALLRVPADQRRVEADGQWPRADLRRPQPQPAGPGVLDLQRASGKLARLLADQDLARCGQGGKLDRTPDGVARETWRVGTAGQRLARRQAAAHRHAQAALLLQDGRRGVDRDLTRERCVCSAQGVILVQSRDTEDAKDALARHGGELPPVAFEGCPEDGQRMPEHDVECLRVQSRRRTRGCPQLHAQHRHLLAHR